MKSRFWTFKKARKYVRKLGIKNCVEWNKWVHSKERNKFIPCDPYDCYKDSGWINYEDWLGCGFLSFNDARALVRSLKLGSYLAWEKWLKYGNRPHNIPAAPCKFYKNKGWVSWEDWIGGYNKFLPYEAAKNIVRKMGFKSQSDWHKRYNELIKSSNFKIPYGPDKVYKEQWVSWMEWLNTNNKIGSIRKHKINDDYFKTWSPNMAYFLGFWFSDGCITDNNIFSMHLHKRDKYILEQFSKKMRSDYPLYSSLSGKYWSFRIRSKEIYNDIIRLGGKERKSLDVKFPKIPKKYLPDFIRGLWDGDGTIHLRKGRTSYRSSYVSGSENFILSLRDSLIKNIPNLKPGIYKGKNKKSKNSFYRLVLDVNDTRRLRDFMYNKKSCLRLERKYIKFVAAGKIKKDIRDRILLSYEEARSCIQKFNIRGQAEWAVFRKTPKKPFNIPSGPYGAYKNKGWVSWLDFLGTGYVSFLDAKQIAMSAGIKSSFEWRKYYLSVKRNPKIIKSKIIENQRIPCNPDIFYKNKGWISWPDFLGTANNAS